MDEDLEHVRPWLLPAALLLLILCLLAFLTLSIHETRKRWPGGPEYLYTRAVQLEGEGNAEEAVDHYYRLLADFPGPPWEERAKQGILRGIVSLRPEPPPPPEAPLVATHRVWRKSYRRLVRLLEENGPGVSAELEEAYEDYRRGYRELIREKRRELERIHRAN